MVYLLQNLETFYLVYLLFDFIFILSQNIFSNPKDIFKGILENFKLKMVDRKWCQRSGIYKVVLTRRQVAHLQGGIAEEKSVFIQN